MTVPKPLRVAFAGTPQFAVPALEALLASPHTVVGVLTQPDRPKGRGRQLTPSPVKQVALAAGVPLEQPLSLRGAAPQDLIGRMALDFMVVVAYGQILPRDILRLPRFGCINIHASLLPRWRGAAPIQRAILAGDAETGVTLIQMDEGLDTGDILLERRVPIGDRDTSASLHERLADAGAQVLLEVLGGVAARSLQARPQSDADAEYAQKLSKSEAQIDWRNSATAISRQVRAFNPWPVAETRFAGETLRIHDAYAPPHGAGGPPGNWLGFADAALRVACGSGELHVTQLQRAGRKVVSAREFVNSAGAAAGKFG